MGARLPHCAPLTRQVNVGEVGAVWQHLAQCCDAPIANVVACGTVKGLDWKTLGFGFTLWEPQHDVCV